VLLDSLAERAYPPDKSDVSDNTRAPVRRELFFGRESEEQAARLKQEAEQASFRTLWIGIISILVTIIGIANALLMSVTERFREIGTMKCLGALSAFIRKLFLIESAMLGFAGAIIGTLLGALLSFTGYGLTFGFALITTALNVGWLLAAAAGCIAGGTLLSMIAAIYPANFAARMVPASALRSNV
jgi:ABC-type lipoprotein release transport system permease subunit